ncbi:MAG: AraC family transcriptional regulator [Ruminococcus sp.]|nr:AraC family transcriptional regulator [Ruminococcus sp.]
MYMNAGYLNNSLVDFKDKTKPLVVGSCGTYRLYNRPKLPTYRPRGRLDFQILYVSSGIAHFHFDHAENDTIVPAGNMVLYRPKEFQKYEYYAADQTEVYWVHFTGGNVTNILRSYGIRDDMRVFYTGTSLEYERLFKRMISELQHCQANYKEMLSMLLRHLLILIHRQLSRQHTRKNEYLEREMDLAAQYFNDHYNLNLCIEDYAASRGMSVSWFIRNFKEYTGTTPMQYIVSIRITNAQMLLETTSYSITEIGNIVGYENPLYFSRIFRKQKGFSPSAYKKQILTDFHLQSK